MLKVAKKPTRAVFGVQQPVFPFIQKRYYRLSVTQKPLLLHKEKFLAIANHSSFMAADLSWVHASLPKWFETAFLLTSWGVAPQRITPIITIDHDLTLLREQISAQPYQAVLVVKGSQPIGEKEDVTSRKYEACIQAIQKASPMLPIFGNLNIYSSIADLMKETKFKQGLGIKGFYTHPITHPSALPDQVPHFLKSLQIPIFPGVIYLTQQHYKNRMEEVGVKRITDSGADRYLMPKMEEGETLEDYNARLLPDTLDFIAECPYMVPYTRYLVVSSAKKDGTQQWETILDEFDVRNLHDTQRARDNDVLRQITEAGNSDL